MTMFRRGWWTLAAATLLVACAGDDDGSDTPDSTVLTSVLDVPPTAATRDVADGSRFLELAEPLNCLIAEVNSTNANDLNAARDSAARVRDAELQFVDALREEQWRAEAQEAIDRLVSTATQQAAVWDAAAEAESEADFQAAVSQLDLPGGAAAAAEARAALGLDTNIGAEALCPGSGG